MLIWNEANEENESFTSIMIDEMTKNIHTDTTGTRNIFFYASIKYFKENDFTVTKLLSFIKIC